MFIKLLLNDVPLGIQVRCAFTWPSRAIGLLGTDPLCPATALWLRPCAAVHTVGMRYSIDVVFLDPQGQVIKMVSPLLPFRWAACRRAYSVIELRRGVAEQLGLQVGDELKAVGGPGADCPPMNPHP